MDIISQLKHEVSERAGSPAGFLCLIQLLMREVERIDVRSPQAPAQYVALLRAYVIVKRQLGRFSHQCEMEALGQPDPWDTVAYNNTFRRLKYARTSDRLCNAAGIACSSLDSWLFLWDSEIHCWLPKLHSDHENSNPAAF